MRNRWARIGVVVGIAVAVNFVARLALRLADGADETVELRTGLISLGAMALVLAVAGFLGTRRYPFTVAAGDLFFQISGATLLVTLIGPFLSGATPFGAGLWRWILQVLVCFGVLVFGAVIGVLIAIAFGLDPKSRAWGAYAAQVKLPEKKAPLKKAPLRNAPAKKTPPTKAPARKARR